LAHPGVYITNYARRTWFEEAPSKGPLVGELPPDKREIYVEDHKGC